MMNWILQSACLAFLLAPLCLGQKLRALSQEEVQELLPGRELGTGARRNEFVTYLACEYDIRDNANPQKVDLSDVVDAIIPSYNELIEDFDDPFQRRIQSATVLSNDIIDDRYLREDVSALEEVHGRKLFVTFTVIEIFGFCFGCVRNLQLTNQVSGRRLATGGGMRYHYDAYHDGQVIERPGAYDSGPDDPYDVDSYDEPEKRPQAPTEEEFLNAYSDFWRGNRDNNANVLDVVGLEEIQRPKGKGGKGKGGKSNKKSGKGKGGKGKGGKTSKTSGKGKGGKKEKRSRGEYDASHEYVDKYGKLRRW